MAFAFDTLGFAKRLEAAGIPREHAEAHAEAAREFIMTELVTKSDLRDAMERLALQLTVRLGAMLVIAVGALATLIRLGA